MDGSLSTAEEFVDRRIAGEADPPVLIPRGLPADGQVCFTQVAIACSSRSAACQCGICGLQPSRCSR
jgi:hypothetical protein